MNTLPHILLTGNAIWSPICVKDEFSIDTLKLDLPANTNGDQDPLVNDIGEYTGKIDQDIDIIISTSDEPKARSMRSTKTCRISYNLVVLISAPSPRLLLTLKLFVPTSVGCLSCASRRRSKPLRSLQGMHLAILFASTTVPAVLQPMSIAGMKTLRLIRFFRHSCS